MIGKRIRGFHALMSTCEPYTPEYGILHTYDHGEITFMAIRSDKFLILCNNYLRYNADALKYDEDKKLDDLYSKMHAYRRMIVIDPKYMPDPEMMVSIYGITLFGKDFMDVFEKFKKANQKLYMKIADVWSDGAIQYVYSMTDGSKNLIDWIYSSRRNGVFSFETFYQILQWREEFPNQDKLLSKGTVTAYNKLSQIMNLRNEMRIIRRDIRANDAVNKFNTAQKKILKECVGDESIRDLLNKFNMLTPKKQQNVITKLSSIYDKDELIRLLRHATSDHFKWSKEDFMDFIENVEGLSYDIIFNEGPCVVLQVKDYETIKQMAKTTNWCISKNKSYWHNYVSNNCSKQYMLFDFSKKEDDDLSIVGFTASSSTGITNAHDFTNRDVMPQRDTIESSSTLHSFFCQNKVGADIYSILMNAKIDFSLIMKGDSVPYEWSAEGVLSHLQKFVDEESIKVLKNEDKKLVVEVQDGRIIEFLGAPYKSRIGDMYADYKHILFYNFAKSPFMSSSVLIGIFMEDQYGVETCAFFDDKSYHSRGLKFEKALAEYRLPYDIIKRPVSKLNVLAKAINNNIYTPELTNGLSDSEIRQVLIEKVGSEPFYRQLTNSIVVNYSFDYLDLVYSHGLSLIDIITSDYPDYAAQAK